MRLQHYGLALSFLYFLTFLHSFSLFFFLFSFSLFFLSSLSLFFSFPPLFLSSPLFSCLPLLFSSLSSLPPLLPRSSSFFSSSSFSFSSCSSLLLPFLLFFSSFLFAFSPLSSPSFSLLFFFSPLFFLPPLFFLLLVAALLFLSPSFLFTFCLSLCLPCSASSFRLFSPVSYRPTNLFCFAFSLSFLPSAAQLCFLLCLRVRSFSLPPFVLPCLFPCACSLSGLFFVCRCSAPAPAALVSRSPFSVLLRSGFFAVLAFLSHSFFVVFTSVRLPSVFGRLLPVSSVRSPASVRRCLAVPFACGCRGAPSVWVYRGRVSPALLSVLLPARSLCSRDRYSRSSFLFALPAVFCAVLSPFCFRVPRCAQRADYPAITVLVLLPSLPLCSFFPPSLALVLRFSPLLSSRFSLFPSLSSLFSLFLCFYSRHIRPISSQPSFLFISPSSFLFFLPSPFSLLLSFLLPSFFLSFSFFPSPLLSWLFLLFSLFFSLFFSSSPPHYPPPPPSFYDF